MSADNHMPRTYVRKKHYTDHLLQKWLLVALVSLELIIVSVAGVILYVKLNTIVEENLYRIHLHGQPSMFMALVEESLWILAGLVLVNAMALLVADRIWAYYVNGILRDMTRMFTRTRYLDLRPDEDVVGRHTVLDRAMTWRQAERDRNLVILRLLDDAREAAERPQPNREQLSALLTAVGERLPDRPTS